MTQTRKPRVYIAGPYTIPPEQRSGHGWFMRNAAAARDGAR